MGVLKQVSYFSFKTIFCSEAVKKGRREFLQKLEASEIV
jgi:hypothetical protein